jgi:hypothetical protein
MIDRNEISDLDLSRLISLMEDADCGNYCDFGDEDDVEALLEDCDFAEMSLSEFIAGPVASWHERGSCVEAYGGIAFGVMQTYKGERRGQVAAISIGDRTLVWSW